MLTPNFAVIFAIINAIGVPTVYFLFPETNGRSLEEIDHIFEQSQGAFDAVGIAKRLPKGGMDSEQHIITDKQSDGSHKSSKEVVEQVEVVPEVS